MGKIPDVMHLYWGKNKPMTWLRYMTVESFAKLNPNWEINVWHPESPGKKECWITNEHKKDFWQGKDWFDQLHKIKNVSVKQADLTGIPNLNDVHRSDIFRWRLLHRFGGWWSDFDILYFAPMAILNVDEEADVALCWGEVEGIENWLAIGFLAGAPGNALFEEMETLALEIAKAPYIGYQDVGTHLLERFYKAGEKETLGCKVHQIKQVSVYPFMDLRTQQNAIWYNRGNLKLDDTVGLHWFAGQKKSAIFESKITRKLKKGELKRNSGISYCFEQLGMLEKPDSVIFEGDIRYSFLMPYADRPMVFFNTLHSLYHHYGDRGDIEVVIVPDEKNQLMDKFHNVVNHWKDKIRIKICEANIGKDIYNPAIHYNIAAREATGSILVITSPEIFHKEDVLSGFDEEFAIDKNCYVVAACRATKQTPPRRIRSMSMMSVKPLKWFQHSVFRDAMFHFCCAISKENYFRIGGFDEEFAKGYCFDDDDFVLNVKDKIVNIVTRDDLLTYHQEHPNLNQVIPNRMKLWNRNKTRLEQKWGIKYEPNNPK